MTTPNFTFLDKLLCIGDNFLKTNFGGIKGSGRKVFSEQDNFKVLETLNISDASKAGSLMRVNHSGEVAAQALYQGQMLVETDREVNRYLLTAANEEADHLNWTSERLNSLNTKPSYLNPVWYSGALMLGLFARLMGKTTSIGFLAETERQVETHLRKHLEIFPKTDKLSIAVLETMLADETKHAEWAEGSSHHESLPIFMKKSMALGSKIMIKVAEKL